MTSSTIVILGMHRSGTSCLAGSLEEAGLVLGEVDRKRHTNPKGNRENLNIMDLNNAVLEANNASWNSPPDAACHWSDEHIQWRDRLIADYPADSLWGFKDPRTLLVLEGWLQGLPGAQLVGTFRHPLAVAGSLRDRNGFEINTSFDLWTRYNRRLLQALGTYGMPLICFDWSAERYNTVLRALALRLGLTPPATRFSFFETGLRRNSIEQTTPLPVAAQDVYQQLLERSDAQLAEAGLADDISAG